MSILSTSNLGWYVSHSISIDKIYQDLDEQDIKLCPTLFKIIAPYNKQQKGTYKGGKKKLLDEKQRKEWSSLFFDVDYVEKHFSLLCDEVKSDFVSNLSQVTDENLTNKEALECGEFLYEETRKHLIKDSVGSNYGLAVIKNINSTKFLFPTNSRFFCKDVLNLKDHLGNEKFDLILLDPPWWNKYIRRKRKKSVNAYSMLHNDQLKELDLQNILTDNGMIVVWCTNSLQHLTTLKKEIFPKWGVDSIGKWFWVKITQSGQPVCSFSEPPGKQPFEQIIFGCKNGRSIQNPPMGKIVLSVPSALHSHKPPLTELLKEYLPENPKCLEIFARYLLPNWTSYGLEALRFQHQSLYLNVD